MAMAHVSIDIRRVGGEGRRRTSMTVGSIPSCLDDASDADDGSQYAEGNVGENLRGHRDSSCHCFEDSD